MSRKSSQSACSHWNRQPCGTYSAPAGYFCSYAELEDIFKVKLKQQSWQSVDIPFTQYSKKNVLEIGIGVGFDLLRFASYGANCFGLDVTERHIDNTLLTFNRYSYNCDLRKEDISITHSSFDDSTFDLIYSFGVIHHIENRENLYHEVARMLKPHGKIIFVTYNLFSLAALSLFIHSIANLNIFRYGPTKILSTIEHGVDLSSTELPYVELHSKHYWITEFNNYQLKVLSASTRQIYFTRLGPLNVLFKPLERLFGWYNIFVLALE
jgi:2-polyprenyl-3-methyl-5-hydroxy-6-metoxy-1,4-benzoquinol methylase